MIIQTPVRATQTELVFHKSGLFFKGIFHLEMYKGRGVQKKKKKCNKLDAFISNEATAATSGFQVTLGLKCSFNSIVMVFLSTLSRVKRLLMDIGI